MLKEGSEKKKRRQTKKGTTENLQRMIRGNIDLRSYGKGKVKPAGPEFQGWSKKVRGKRVEPMRSPSKELRMSSGKLGKGWVLKDRLHEAQELH